MRLHRFEHLQPKSLAEACAILAEHGDRARIIAGGTDIIPRMKQRLVEPQILVDVKDVYGIGSIRSEGGELIIGAVATLTDVHESRAIREAAPALAEAAAAVGAAQLQNMGTIGGNLCLDTRCWYYNQTQAWRRTRAACRKVGGDACHMAPGGKRCYALYSGDSAAALLALGARARIVSSQGEREVPLEYFFVDDGKNPTVLRSDEILAEVVIPAPANGPRSTYLKYRRREAIDFPIVGVGAALNLENGICREARVAITGVASAPFLVWGAQAVLQGNRVSRELVDAVAEAAYKQAKPVSRTEVSPGYRKHLVRVLVKDALSRLAGLV